MNFNRIAIRTTRAYNQQSNKAEILNHVKNLVLLFPASHAIELALSPVFIYFGTTNGWPSIVVATGGAILAVLGIPGADILCYALYGIYPFKFFHKPFDLVRRASEYALRGTITTLRIDRVFNSSIEYKDRLEVLKAAIETARGNGEHLEVHLERNERETELRLKEVTTGQDIFLLQTQFDPEERRNFVKRVAMSRDTLANYWIENWLAQLLPWNLRNFVHELNRESLTELNRQFYVEEVRYSNHTLDATLADRAIFLPNKPTLSKSAKSFLGLPRRPTCRRSYGI